LRPLETGAIFLFAWLDFQLGSGWLFRRRGGLQKWDASYTTEDSLDHSAAAIRLIVGPAIDSTLWASVSIKPAWAVSLFLFARKLRTEIRRCRIPREQLGRRTSDVAVLLRQRRAKKTVAFLLAQFCLWAA
jgi:hypothetical protein